MEDILTGNESRRLAALARYDILDTPAEPAFDDLTQLAAQVCETPIALVTLIDDTRQWFKSCVGVDIRETPRALSFCRYALDQTEPLIVPDMREDARFSDHPSSPAGRASASTPGRPWSSPAARSWVPSASLTSYPVGSMNGRFAR